MTAASGLGLKPKECIGVEDAQAGIDAINQAGMLAIGVGQTDLDGADIMIKGLEEFDIEKYQSMAK